RRLSGEMSENEAGVLARQANAANVESLIGSVALVGGSLSLGLFVLLYVRKISTELLHLTGSLANNSGNVARLSAEVGSAPESLAKGSAQQASMLAETSSSAEEVTTMTQRNAENSQTAADVMNTVDGHVKASNRTLEEMVISMRDINDSSGKISRIIKV